mmetsp:Transcript_13420/g.42125  ORF Transcript_13420/g.42125 Transcript_13420/m.42125 type:complete len:288 (-) Transcript_13420:224-1087(-)
MLVVSVPPPLSPPPRPLPPALLPLPRPPCERDLRGALEGLASSPSWPSVTRSMTCESFVSTSRTRGGSEKSSAASLACAAATRRASSTTHHGCTPPGKASRRCSGSAVASLVAAADSGERGSAHCARPPRLAPSAVAGRSSGGGRRVVKMRRRRNAAPKVMPSVCLNVRPPQCACTRSATWMASVVHSPRGRPDSGICACSPVVLADTNDVDSTSRCRPPSVSATVSSSVKCAPSDTSSCTQTYGCVSATLRPPALLPPELAPALALERARPPGSCILPPCARQWYT